MHLVQAEAAMHAGHNCRPYHRLASYAGHRGYMVDLLHLLHATATHHATMTFYANSRQSRLARINMTVLLFLFDEQKLAQSTTVAQPQYSQDNQHSYAAT